MLHAVRFREDEAGGYPRPLLLWTGEGRRLQRSAAVYDHGEMTRMELTAALDALGQVRVAVVGDFCLDAYWILDESRSEISIETGLRTRPIREHRYFLGGAGNVAMNLRALRVGDLRVFGVTGEDPFGRDMRRLMTGAGMKTEGLMIQSRDWNTHVYIKPHVGGVEQQRLDFGNFNVLADATATELLGRLRGCLAEIDVVIINEQVPSGIHASTTFRSGLNALIREHSGRRFVLDSRHYHDRYEGAIRKMNDREAVRLWGRPRAPDEPVPAEEVIQAATALRQRWGQPVVVTRGPRGCVVCDEQGHHEIPGLLLSGPIDPVGAGDTFLAAFSAALAAGYDVVTAATLGNFAAAVVVQKRFQTGTATPDEILAVGADPDYVYRPELAEDPRRARYLAGTEIEVVTVLPSAQRITHAVFDHDGTISTLRQGWEDVMEGMMVRAILGDVFSQADEALYAKVVQRVRDYIDKTTGVQTIVQMQGLVELVREFGCVPQDQVLDPAGYKAVYNAALMERVNRRLAKLGRGELDIADLTLKNAIAFLRRLYEAGVRLYLASGTDIEDVIREARALGYADVFEGHIYGSIGMTERDAKRVVIERILNDIGSIQAKCLVTFGDGPVEIRETHKRGGVTVGVASDEVRRFGLNLSKRARLIRAGADLIIPDFSQMNRLLTVLGFTDA